MTTELATLTTDRLVLRQPKPEDLEAYLSVIGDDDSEREHRDALAHWRAHGFGPWIVDDAATGESVGILEVHYAGPGVTGLEPHEVEIGWTVIEARRGQGLAGEAARAAIDDAWTRARNDHGWIVAYIRPENDISQRVATRLGLRHEADGLTRSGHPMQVWRLRA
ncbi:MAG TPA: GNAT family N-acetyltransferase [Candidatus Limnocylindrales bacterium]|nr:GNAT family N-acetyltransferase [Candidatus Limnocylindrales bacterium]